MLKKRLRDLLLCLFAVFSMQAHAQEQHGYVALVGGMVDRLMEKTMWTLLVTMDPNGHYVVDRDRGEVQLVRKEALVEEDFRALLEAEGFTLIALMTMDEEDPFWSNDRAGSDASQGGDDTTPWDPHHRIEDPRMKAMVKDAWIKANPAAYDRLLERLRLEAR